MLARKVSSTFVMVVAAFALLLIYQNPGATAQVASTGAVNGEVTDPSGAVVPNATATLGNVATGATYTGSTNAAGLFNFPFLSPGTYTLTVKKDGFQTSITHDLIVQVNGTRRRDVELLVGALAQEVAVTAHPLEVDTENASLGGVIGSKTITSLPLNGRAFLQLGTLVAGTYPAGPGSNTEPLSGNRPGLAIEMGGLHEGSTAFLFDGVAAHHDFYGAVGISPPPDAIAEFKIQTGYFSPQYGLPSVVNVVMKSGTNEFHGGVWEFLRNDVFDARSFFEFKRSPYKQNQFGGDVGGPILKNRLFFFGDYEGLRFVSENTTSTGFVPTTAMLKGDFSALSTLIYDPSTYSPATGAEQPFPGNMIPSNRISAFASKFNQFIPAPNTPPLAEFAGANLLGTTESTLTDNKFSAKVDYNESEKDRVFGRFTLLNSGQVSTSLIPGDGTQTPLRSRNAVLGWTHVFSPRLVNEARVGLDRAFLDTNGPTNASSPDWPTQLGLTNLNEIKQCNAIPAVRLAKYTGLGFQFQNCIITGNTDKIVLDNLSWMHGPHQITMGGQMIRVNLRDIAAFTQNGSFSFTGQYTGDSVADYLLGNPFSVSGEKPLAPSEWRAWWPDLYINDDFKATRRLTLNFGLRWQYTQPPIELSGHQSEFNFATGQIQVVGQPGVRRRILSSHYLDFAPRVGFAYSPRQNWAVRGSYGVFWDRLPGNELAWENVGPPFTAGYSAVGTPTVPTISIPGLFPSFTPNLVGASLFTLMNRKNPYDQQWTFSVQHTLPFNLLAEAAYVGIKGAHLSTRADMNTAATPGGPRPYPQYGFIAADMGAGAATYNALELTVRKALGHGLSFLSAYTYANALATAGNNWGAFNFTWTHLDYGLATSSVRHRWVTSFEYALPFGNNLRGVVRQLASGWDADGIVTFQSGYPFSVGMLTQPSNTKSTFGNGYPNRVCNGGLNNPTIREWFNTSCFVVPPLNTFGDAGINYLYGPGSADLDFGLHKDFPFGENRHFEFRAESFNMLNNVNFGFPSATIGSPSYGQIHSAASGRIMQFALKLIF